MQDIIEGTHGFRDMRLFVEHDTLSPLAHCRISYLGARWKSSLG
jgi:hypothetical protein